MKGDNTAFAGSKKIISDCVNSYTSGDEKFKNFASPKRMLLAASQALRSADAIVIAVQSSAYNSVKKMICSAFNIALERNEEIYSALLPLYEKKKITKTAFENNTSFPANADIFAVSDYKCCGFSVTSGAQSIIVLPLDNIKTGEVVFGSLYEFLGEAAGVENDEDISKLKRGRIAGRLVSLLKKNKNRIAFTALSGVQLIEESIDMVDPEHEIAFVAEKPEPRQPAQQVKDYIVSVAQKTRETSKAEYACAVSSAFASNTDNSTFIYAAVADKNETRVTKLYAQKNESHKHLYRSAVEFALLSCVSKVNADIASAKEENRREDKLLRQKIAFITAGAVAGATVISTVLAIIFN